MLQMKTTVQDVIKSTMRMKSLPGQGVTATLVTGGTLGVLG